MMLAISAAFAFKPAAKTAFFAARYEVISNTCTEVSRPDCQGNSSHAQCDGIFTTKTAEVCENQAFKTN